MTIAPPSETTAKATPAKAWMRAIERTSAISRQPERILPSIIDEVAARSPGSPALLSGRESFTYAELSARSNRYANWAVENKARTVALLMPNRPEYLAIWLGITKTGATAALLNTNLSCLSLAHTINAAGADHVIVAPELLGRIAIADLKSNPRIWLHGEDFKIEDYSAEPPSTRRVTVNDRALYIYTSGTTGLPKAAVVSHARILHWSLWFAGMLDASPEDRMYNCLPMYHSVGGVLAPGAILSTGGSLVTREKFSASQFWNEVIGWDCTLVQYIGELCRYLLQQPGNAAGHRVRIACGNGLRPDVWEQFQKRFDIPRILEFYASTEGGVSLFNAEGKAGSIGRVPPYLAHRFAPALIQFDTEKNEPVRDENGFCLRADTNLPGEAIGAVSTDAGTRFEGYTDPSATSGKILRSVFKPGDTWIRTGDLMRKDKEGFFYFVDRIGDTFRWKGENVATLEVAETICECGRVKEANVYGVALPHADGRAGMALLVPEPGFDLTEFRAHLASRLPKYARPLFLRIRDSVDLTGTFKYAKSDLIREGFDPSATSDLLYVDHPEHRMFVPISPELYASIQEGEIRF
jgi:fatty-acyl-CoA synthase